MTAFAIRRNSIRLLLLLLSLAVSVRAQIPTSFQSPILGYFIDSNIGKIRPISGIPGSARIELPLTLPFTIRDGAILPDQQHAIITTTDQPGVFVVDLKSLTARAISGAPSSVSEIRISPDGSIAALFAAAESKMFVAIDLSGVATIRDILDVPFTGGSLREFAISNDGSVLLMDFASNDEENLYTWKASDPPRFVMRPAHVSNMSFRGDDAVILDSGANEALLIRNVRDQAEPIRIAGPGDGLDQPSALFVSNRGEIYIGSDLNTILRFDESGRLQWRTSCHCVLTTMAPLVGGWLRLTNRLDQPLIIFDGNRSGDVLFIPALPELSAHGSGR